MVIRTGNDVEPGPEVHDDGDTGRSVEDRDA